MKTAENLTAAVEGDIADVDGVLKITEIRLRYRGMIPAGLVEKIPSILDSYAAGCPAYQSVKGCIRVTWTAEFEVGET